MNLLNFGSRFHSAHHCMAPVPRMRLHSNDPESTGAELYEHKTWFDYGIGGGSVYVLTCWAHGPCSDPDSVFALKSSELFCVTPASLVPGASSIHIPSEVRGKPCTGAPRAIHLMMPLISLYLMITHLPSHINLPSHTNAGAYEKFLLGNSDSPGAPQFAGFC